MATIDPVRNKARVTVAAGYDQAATSVSLVSGETSKLPASSEGAFNMIWWNATDYPDPIDDPNYEIVRVTLVVGNVLTITRAQEATAAATHNSVSKNYRMALVATKNTIDQIRSAFAVIVKAVLSGVTSAVQVNAIPGLTTASNISVSWGVNSNTPLGAPSIKEVGDDGHIIVESTADEGGVDKNIVITLYP
jgi:hypothetical protein